ncbi:hypothetical protein [Isoalcanivorax indicus]|uniref:hypothetical protein n=1 Tax=Isoalcanivorax indicus TaxID=2202653 RepID=UPI000DB93C2E|nr:hypothetical protein [Isoalcanivorax indicus]
MRNILNFIPPQVLARLIYSYLLISLLLKFFFRTTYGLLIIAVLIYFNAELIFGCSPLNSEEIFSVLVSLEKEYKVALISSSVTIVGFAVAFHTATINWRSQMRSNIMLGVATEIEDFFSNALKSITTVQLYAEELIRDVSGVQAATTMQEAAFIVNFNISRQQEFYQARQAISESSIEVHRFLARGHNALASNWGALPAMHRAEMALSEIATKMWISIPNIDAGDTHKVQAFIKQVSLEECHSLIKCCDRNARIISSLYGGVRGQLESTIMGVNVPMFFSFLAQRKGMMNAIENLHESLR